MKKELEYVMNSFKEGSITRSELINHVTPVILRIPKFYNNFDEDIAHDYYIMILMKIDSLFDKYSKFENCRFETWFIHILKRQFMQFMEKKKTRNRFVAENRTIDSDFSYENTQSDHDLILCEDYTADDLPMNKLSRIELKVADLKYGLSYDTTHTHQTDKTRNKLNILEVRLINAYNRILDLREKMEYVLDQAQLNELKNKERELVRRKRNNEYRYHRIKLTTSNKWIGAKLNIAEGTVGSYLTKIKRKIKSHYDSVMKDKNNQQ